MMAWERKKEAIEGREEVAVVETVCLARQLRPFGIKPATLRINYVPAKVTVSTISATSSNVTSQGPTSKPSPPNPATTTKPQETANPAAATHRTNTRSRGADDSAPGKGWKRDSDRARRKHHHGGGITRGISTTRCSIIWLSTQI